MGKETWRPAWEQDAREPAWALPSMQENWRNPFGCDRLFLMHRLCSFQGRYFKEDLYGSWMTAQDLSRGMYPLL